MKKLIIGIISTTLAIFSISAFADKVTISGTPVVVEKQADIYVPTTTVTTTDNGYYYFTMDNGSNRVCYREVQPALAKIDAGVFRFRVGSDTVSLHCYDYNTEYFIVN